MSSEQTLAEAIPDGILMLDAKGGIVWSNQVAQELLGLTNAVKPQQLLSSIFSTALMSKIKESAALGEWAIMVSPVNDSRYLSVTLRPYTQNTQLLIVKDITRTRRLESMRQDFIANVSHELRTPLTVFHGYLELLQTHQQLRQDAFEDVLNHMVEQNNRMEQLVEDLLWLSRLESVQPNVEEYQTIPIASIIRDVCKDAQSLSGEQKHVFQLKLDEMLTLKGNPEELRSAFSNIVYNAVHYTPPGGLIIVSWYANAHGKYFSVTDTGVGIPDKYISRITQRFYRLDKARSHKHKGGTGLGLAIVKHVLLRHRGELHIQSKVGKGSTFTCYFPRLCSYMQ